MINDSDRPPLPPAQEPSVLDYLRSKLSFGRRPAIALPPLEGARPSLDFRPETSPVAQASRAAVLTRGADWLAFVPWRSVFALALGLLAQGILEPPGVSVGLAIGLYVAAVGLLLWSALRGEWRLANNQPSSAGADSLEYRRTAFLTAIPAALIAFLAFTDNLFTGFNLALWLAVLGLIVVSLRVREPGKPSVWRRISDLMKRQQWEIRFDRWTLLVLAVVGLVLFFRLYHLQQTPAEPFSDHAEKLLDVYEVSQGQTHIFFPRNTGREALQMYWTLLVSWIFGTGFSFLSLKLGTALIGLLDAALCVPAWLGSRRPPSGLAFSCADWDGILAECHLAGRPALPFVSDVRGTADVLPDPRACGGAIATISSWRESSWDWACTATAHSASSHCW